MLFIAICDDEPLILEKLSECLHVFMQTENCEYELVLFKNGETLLKSKLTFNIILMDIKMDEIDGMTAAKSIRKANSDCVIIFITGLKEYVFDAFDVDAMNYLLKPIDIDKLNSTLQKAIRKFAENNAKFIMLGQGQSKNRINISQITYCEVLNHEIFVHTIKSSESYYEKIQKLELELDGESFFRCHRSYIVNLKYVTNLKDNDFAVLSTGEKIPVAARRKLDFKQALLHCKRNEVL